MTARVPSAAATDSTPIEHHALRHLKRIPPSAGHFDELELKNETLRGKGWLFHRPYRLSRATVFVDGLPIENCEREPRPDVAQVCAWAPEAEPYGFRFEIPMGLFEGDLPHRLDIVAYERSRPVARLSSFCPPPTREAFPVPPPELAVRVSGVTGETFRVQGLKMYTDLVDTIEHYALPKAGRLLDWGCGCGRVLRWFLQRNDFLIKNATTSPDEPPLGCDIDPDAIGWCRTHYGARFEQVPFDPPTQLPTAAYDLVMACSVLTHLDRDRQLAWLAEVHRWLLPGGYFLASTNAEFAFRLQHPTLRHEGWRRWVETHAARWWRPPLMRDILDGMPDPNIRWVIPEDTYRMVFAPRWFTEKLCAQYFDVLGYIECGLDGYQDLIVCRKRRV